MGTSPAPRPASQLRQWAIAPGRSASGWGTSVTGTSVTDARHAANDRTTSETPKVSENSTSIICMLSSTRVSGWRWLRCGSALRRPSRAAAFHQAYLKQHDDEEE